MRLLRRIRRDESGFTLAELLVALVIETVIFAALATTFLVVVHGGSNVNESLKKSSDARAAAAYIVSDARNSSGPEISLTDTVSCADPAPPVVGTQTAVARFDWNAPNAAGTLTANTSNYTLVTGLLLRRHCEGGALVNDAVLASSITSLSVTCSPIADCSGVPTSITVAIVETPDTIGGQPYSYSLTAAFRKLIDSGGSLVPSPPQSLVVFGSGGCGVNISGAGTMRVYGNAFVNTADSATCKAMSLGNSGIFEAGGTSILTGGSCVASGGSVCPTVTPYSPALVDPYAGLVAPTTAGRPVQTTGCSGPAGAQTAQPGVYAGVFALGGGDTCTLESGIYILQAGFNLSNGGVLKTAAGGVLIYVTGGAFAVGGGGSLTLTAATTGTYAGLVVWQAAADTSTISFSNGGALVFNGAIYAPRAELNVSGNAQTPIATAIAVQTVVITNSGGISIGASAVRLSISAPASLPPWTVGRAYSAALTATGGDGSYSWSSTALPAGLALDAYGVISGTPTAAGATSVTITLNDSLGDTPDTNAYTLTINAVPAITTAALLEGDQALAYSVTLARTGGTAALTWSATGLPSNLVIGPSTGIISGTPAAAGTFPVSVTLTDAAGATDSADYSLVIGTKPTITNVVLTNVANAGTIAKGDKIVVTFSKEMDVTSFCSVWANNGTDQSLVADSDVTITVVNGAHDSISVASGKCTFAFGSIDLGTNTYVSPSNAIFKGTGANKSTIVWSTTAHTLTITFGAKASGGTLGTVATSTPTYTAPNTVKDLNGGLLTPPTFMLPGGQQF